MHHDDHVAYRYHERSRDNHSMPKPMGRNSRHWWKIDERLTGSVGSQWVSPMQEWDLAQGVSSQSALSARVYVESSAEMQGDTSDKIESQSCRSTISGPVLFTIRRHQ